MALLKAMPETALQRKLTYGLVGGLAGLFPSAVFFMWDVFGAFSFPPVMMKYPLLSTGVFVVFIIVPALDGLAVARIEDPIARDRAFSRLIWGAVAFTGLVFVSPLALGAISILT